MEANQQKHSFTERSRAVWPVISERVQQQSQGKLILPTTTTDGFASSAAVPPSVRAYLRTQ
jgi:hypothetical protein